jgi:hypothetical protein
VKRRHESREVEDIDLGPRGDEIQPRRHLAVTIERPAGLTEPATGTVAAHGGSVRAGYGVRDVGMTHGGIDERHERHRSGSDAPAVSTQPREIRPAAEGTDHALSFWRPFNRRDFMI